MLHICDLSSKPSHIVTDYAIQYKFPLDIFQEHAISAIDQGHNVLVCAKTGSGKTLVGEYQIAHSLKQGKRVFYTTPIKSLSNQKFHDLRQLWPEPGAVGIMTGDMKFCPDAKIIVMTTEILRNLLYKRGTATEHLGLTASLSLNDLGAVVFDECHYINDKDRGKVWEETMILLPPEVQLILLSATLDRPEFFAQWLGELKQVPCHLIQTQFRVVPLTHYIVRGSQLVPMMDSKEVFRDDNYADWLRSRAKAVKDHEEYQKKVANARRAGHEGPIDGKTRPVSFSHQLNELIGKLQADGLLPALAFVLSRKGCEIHANRTEAQLLDSSDSALSLKIFDFHLHRHKESLEKLPQYHAIRRLIQKGVAFHHSGLLPLLKEVIEILFTKGLIKLLYCTETFAVGINMPTKTVIFTGLSKYDDATKGMRLLRTDEYIQMAGRAGRRGKDPVGTVIYLPEHEPPSTGEMRMILKGGRPQIMSRMDFHYDFLLKCFHQGTVGWRGLQANSYWKRQIQTQLEVERRELEKIQSEKTTTTVDSATRLALQEEEAIVEQIQTLTNARRKAAQRCLDRWREEHDSPFWANARKQYETYKTLSKHEQVAIENIQSFQSNTGHADDFIHILQKTGYLTEAESPALTRRGIVATEFNEGHPLLCTEFLLGGHHKDLTADELIATFACLVEEKETDQTPSVDELSVTPKVRNSLYTLDELTKIFTKEEADIRVYSPESYWALTTTWIEPVWRWLHEENAAQICSDYGLFEGNFVRTILRMSNVVDELTSVATFLEDLELLEKLKDCKQRLLRDFMIPDSLYLHL